MINERLILIQLGIFVILNTMCLLIAHLLNFPGHLTTALGPIINLSFTVIFIMESLLFKFKMYRPDFLQFCLYIYFFTALFSLLFGININPDFMLFGFMSDFLIFLSLSIIIPNIKNRQKMMEIIGFCLIIGVLINCTYTLYHTNFLKFSLIKYHRLSIGDWLVFTHGNYLANQACIAFIFGWLILKINTNKIISLLLCCCQLLFVIFIVLTLSKTVLLTFLILVPVMILFDTHRLVKLSFYILSMTIFYILYSEEISIIFNSYLDSSNLFGTFTFTYRTKIWIAVFNDAFNNLATFLFGNGYNGLKYGLEVEGHRNAYLLSHNDFLNILWSTGLFGLISLYLAFFGLLRWSVKKLIKLRKEKSLNIPIYFHVVLTIYIFIRGFSENNLGLTYFNFTIYLLIANLMFAERTLKTQSNN
ncbi:hypothetical protein JW835_14720 [bacterium]|nr:hypothetical protein [bacterium]